MKQVKWLGLGVISFLITLLLSGIFANRTVADIDDFSLAKVEVFAQKAEVTFTVPTDFIGFADGNENGKIEAQEVTSHQQQLESFLRDRVRLSNQEDIPGQLTVQPSPKFVVPPSYKITPDTHTTLILTYTWPKTLQTLNVKYNLFPAKVGMGLPSLPTAHCLATIHWEDQVKTQVLNATNKQVAVSLNFNNNAVAIPFLKETQGQLIAIIGAFLWGSFHALSPGHGKTMVSAYLVGSKANLKQAVVLGLTTTITHTIGVFAFGFIAWAASQYLLTDLSPWLSLLSGIIIVVIGLSLVRQRLATSKHHHHHHHHSHSKASWRQIFALGISGGLVPCPAATVLLLSTIALGQIAYGLTLVSVFSVGLAVTLTSLSVLFIYGKQQFQKLPQKLPLLKKLPIFGAIAMTMIGMGITGHAIVAIIA
ncbi:MAG: high-affinity nickel-transporter [Cyanobacteria bacterium SW_9_44_58]|nr:MAG: high-affinity nickel-transporter [Cyanobacteria bacterium SW_9_44_58]